MSVLRMSLVLVVSWFLVGGTFAGDAASPLLTAAGVVEKVDKDNLTVRPRGAGGKFEKNLMLQLTGTSEITTLTTQKRSGKLVFVQKKTDAKDLRPNQAVAVIYTTGAAGPVLLTAVAHPAAEK